MKSSANKIANCKSANQPKPIVVMRDVSMWFAYPVQALRHVSLEVRRGEVFGLLGPKGSGKSTLLKILAGRMSPTNGNVKVLGRSFLRRIRRSGIGYLPEKTTRNREPSLAQALVKDPELVILDEPFASLDIRARHEMKDLIYSLTRRGKTVVLTSDSLSDAKDICDRLAVLFEGRIQAIGTLEELLASPEAVRFTAPLLPEVTADRLLKIVRDDIRKENLKQALATSPTGSAPEQILTLLANTTESGPPSSSAGEAVDGVNHERLAQLTKPAK